MKKKLKLLSISIMTFFLGFMTVYAAPSATISVNKSSIELGQSVTATVKVTGVAAWNVRIDSSGSTSGCSQRFADASSDAKNTTKTFTVTCKSTSLGIISFSMSGDITDASGVNKNISGSKSVTVKAVTPKSSNNNLKELSVDGYTLTPEFNAAILKYNLQVTPDVTKVKINAKASDNASKVKGSGEFDVSEGDNTFEIVVTAENGATKTYTINVTVPEKNPIETTLDGKSYSILRKLPDDTPLYFEKKTITIDNDSIEALYNEKLDITLVYVKDENNNLAFYIYEDNKLKELFQTIASAELLIILADIEEPFNKMILVDLIIDGDKVKAMQIKENKQFYIIKGINIQTGETQLYNYDYTNGTLSLFDEEGYLELIKTEKTQDLMPIVYGLASAIGIQILIIILMSRNKSKLSKALRMVKESKDDKKK